MFSMPMCSWIRHQSLLIVFRLFEMPIFLPFRSSIRKISSRARTAMQPPSYTHVAPSSTRAAEIRVNVDRRIQAAEADEVVEVVDVVRVPVVLGCVAEVGVLDADLLELLTAPPSSWSTLFADTIGQFVNHTSFQSNGTVVDTRVGSSVIVAIRVSSRLS